MKNFKNYLVEYSKVKITETYDTITAKDGDGNDYEITIIQEDNYNIGDSEITVGKYIDPDHNTTVPYWSLTIDGNDYQFEDDEWEALKTAIK